jgi:hypothetical protein
MPGCCCWTEAIVGGLLRKALLDFGHLVRKANSATGGGRGASGPASGDRRRWLALCRVEVDGGLFVMAGVDDSGCGWMDLGRPVSGSRCCLARASWPKGKVRVRRRGWLVQNKSPSRRDLGIRVADKVLMARSGGGNSGRCCRSTTESRRLRTHKPEVALACWLAKTLAFTCCFPHLSAQPILISVDNVLFESNLLYCNGS